MGAFITWLVIALLLVVILFFIAVTERWNNTGRFEISYPVRQLFRLLQQEDIKPGQRDKIFYEVAPVLFVAAGMGAFSVLPLLEDTVLVDMATGGLFLNAALAYIMVAMVMAGWSTNSVYSLIGGWRFLAQLIAYSMPIVMTITAAVMRAESINLLKIIESQQSLWNIIYQPLGFILFFLSAQALSFLPPFDLPVSRGELAGGAWAEFTGVRKMVWKTGRLLLILTLSVAIVVLFLGGWQGPWFPAYVWMFLKTAAVIVLLITAGKKISRFHHDRLIAWSWKYATPAALVNIFYVGVILLL